MSEWFALDPHDTVFFRDGRPFNQDDEGLTSAESVFPPPPNSLVGGFRAACALANGWDGKRSWASYDALGKQLGDGDDLGDLCFQGPFLAHPLDDDREELRPLFAMPFHVLAKAGDEVSEVDLLRPSDEMLETDVRGPDGARAAQRLLEPASGASALGKKAPPDRFVTADGLNQALAGQAPSSETIIHQDRLWHREPRVGLARCSVTHSARHGMLYLADHIRLDRGTRLLFAVEGLDDGTERPTVGTFGRYRRLADIDAVGEAPAWPSSVLPAPDQGENGGCRYIVVLTSPARFDDHGWRRVGGRLADLPGRIVTAALNRPAWIGGWNDGTYGRGQRGPRDLQSFLPAGSVWFMEQGPGDGDLQGFTWPKAIGSKTAWGFGAYLIGRWP